MASIKERARWDKWFNQVTARMNRQGNSIRRLVLINTETIAALAEIQGMDPQGDEWDDAEAFRRAQDRAHVALARVQEMSAAVRENVEATEAETPVTDPRSNNE